MPIEIRELHIKGVLTNEDDRGAGNQVASQPDKNTIINACVDKTVKILEDKKER